MGGRVIDSHTFTYAVESAGSASAISMDGVGCVIDNVYNKRFGKSVKYEDVYLKLYQTPDSLFDKLTNYIRFYNHQ